MRGIVIIFFLTFNLMQINAQIREITKLTLSKISNIKVSDNEIKEIVENIQKKVIN